MADNKGHNDNKNKRRTINADSNNKSIAAGRTRAKDTLDLDFDFGFRRKEQSAEAGSVSNYSDTDKVKQYGLFPEYNLDNNPHLQKEASKTTSPDKKEDVIKEDIQESSNNSQKKAPEKKRVVINMDGPDTCSKKSEMSSGKKKAKTSSVRNIKSASVKSGHKNAVVKVRPKASVRAKPLPEKSPDKVPEKATKPAPVKASVSDAKTVIKSESKTVSKPAAKSETKVGSNSGSKAATKASAKGRPKNVKVNKNKNRNKKKDQNPDQKSNNNNNNNNNSNSSNNKSSGSKKGKTAVKPSARLAAAKTPSGQSSGKGSSGSASKASDKSSKASDKSSKTSAKSSKAPVKKTPEKRVQRSDISMTQARNARNKKKVRKKRSKFVTFVRALVITFISLMILGCVAGGAYTAYIVSHAAPIHPERIYDTLAVTSHIYDDKGKLVDDIYYNENREITTYEQLPDNLKNAFIAIEDKTFWTHKGFNFRRIIGAILEKFKGGSISGTSTITQQLARNVFLPEDKSVRSLKRKITEMYYAYQIEEELSKEEILTAYLNTIYLGYGCYGVNTASKIYFDKAVEDLSLEQCAALAALPQAPGLYALLVTEEGENTTKIRKGLYANDISESRRNLVLKLMEEQSYITAEERETATRPLADFIEPGSTAGVASTSAFKDYLIETVKHDLMDKYGLTEDQATNMIYTKGLNIYSTMDSQAQKVITKEFKDKDNFPSTVKKGVTPEAAMVVTEVGTGKVKAMVGTRSADGQMLFNRATNPRQPGSSIKPLTVYAAALQKSYEYQKKGQTFRYVNTGYDRQGKSGWGSYITVSSTVVDERMKVNGDYWPNNVNLTFTGKKTFRRAIQLSINTCAVKILAQVGIDYAMNMLHNFGITTAIDDRDKSVNDLNYAALALGAMSEGVTPLEMSLAYAAFPNGGVRNTPICYTKVVDSNGRTILESKSHEERVMNEGVAWIMTNVLQSVVSDGIGYPAAVSGIRVGGKTGTTDSRYDIWFDGFTPNYSAALWIGTDNNVKMDSYSEKAAALWGKIVGQIKRAKKGSYPSMPSNVYRAWDGEYYTTGTAPPEPEPEPEEDEEGEDGKGKTDAKTDTKTDAGKADSKAGSGDKKN